MHSLLMRKLVWVLAFVLLRPLHALAQEPLVVPAPGSAAPSAHIQRPFSQQELDKLLAPIAVYPDALLAQILMASTYPLEVVEAARWVRAHPNLKGDQLQAALQEQGWDPSVKGLTTVPQVLTMMDEKLDWTERLGDAFLAQQQAVMDTIQGLRSRARAAGNLASTPQQTVVTEGNAILIEPASPEIIYVPVYNPAVIYGLWWWPAPPFYWYPPGYVATGPFIYFGVGVVVGAAIWGACDWGHRTVVVNVHSYNVYNRARIVNPQWTHDADHRRGVPYRDDATRSRFGRELPGADARRDFRGYEQPPQSREAARPDREQIREQPALRGAQLGRPQMGERHELPEAARPPAAAGEHAPPAFETFGRGDAARAYSNRGAASRGVHEGAGGGGAPRGHR
jgi:hypothetical protein